VTKEKKLKTLQHQVHVFTSTIRSNDPVSVVSCNNNNLYHQRLVKEARPPPANFIDLGDVSSGITSHSSNCRVSAACGVNVIKSFFVTTEA
jgi:hypothetical protein